jgi:FkbM family methyltransferase
VECSPDTLAVLENNVRKNNLDNVEIYPVAAAEERGTLKLNLTAIGLSWLPPHPNWPISDGGRRTVSVPAVPLDEIIQSPVHFVKIDAEGVDLEVLKGMKPEDIGDCRMGATAACGGRQRPPGAASVVRGSAFPKYPRAGRAAPAASFA